MFQAPEVCYRIRIDTMKVHQSKKVLAMRDGATNGLLFLPVNRCIPFSLSPIHEAGWDKNCDLERMFPGEGVMQQKTVLISHKCLNEIADPDSILKHIIDQQLTRIYFAPKKALKWIRMESL